MGPTLKKTISFSLSFVYFTTQVVLGSAAEVNLWSERRKQVAALPLQLPSIQAALPVASRWAGSNKKNLGVLPPHLGKLVDSLPLTYASIQDVYDSGSAHAPVALLIQDVHMNAEAQSNIAALLQELIDRKQAGVVGVEGAFDAFDFTPFRTLPDKKITRDVTAAFLSKNILAAPSFVGITSAVEPPLFIGMDDKISYTANVKAYLDSRNLKDAALRDVQDRERRLSELKRKIFSPELRRFDDLRAARRQGTLGYGAYLKKLAAYDVEKELVMERFLAAYEMEQSLDFSRVDRERRQVIGALTKVLSEKETSTLVSESLAYRMGRIGFGDYYQGLKDLCEKHGIPLRQTPAFDDYIRYVLLSDGIKAEALFNAVDKAEKKILTSLIRTPEETNLARESEHLVLCEKLIDFSLTPQEWEEYQLSPPLVGGGRGRGINLSSFESFYTNADIRSAKMVTNLFSNLQSKTKNSNVVLIAGGFHTPQVAKLLRDRKISYVVVSPKITKIDDASGSAYLSVFTREKTPLDKLFAGEKLFVNPTDVNIASSFRTMMLLRAEIRNFEIDVHHLPASEQNLYPLFARYSLATGPLGWEGELWNHAVEPSIPFHKGSRIVEANSLFANLFTGRWSSLNSTFDGSPTPTASLRDTQLRERFLKDGGWLGKVKYVLYTGFVVPAQEISYFIAVAQMWIQARLSRAPPGRPTEEPVANVVKGSLVLHAVSSLGFVLAIVGLSIGFLPLAYVSVGVYAVFSGIVFGFAHKRPTLAEKIWLSFLGAVFAAALFGPVLWAAYNGTLWHSSALQVFWLSVQGIFWSYGLHAGYNLLALVFGWPVASMGYVAHVPEKETYVLFKEMDVRFLRAIGSLYKPGTPLDKLDADALPQMDFNTAVVDVEKTGDDIVAFRKLHDALMEEPADEKTDELQRKNFEAIVGKTGITALFDDDRGLQEYIRELVGRCSNFILLRRLSPNVVIQELELGPRDEDITNQQSFVNPESSSIFSFEREHVRLIDPLDNAPLEYDRFVIQAIEVGSLEKICEIMGYALTILMNADPRVKKYLLLQSEARDLLVGDRYRTQMTASFRAVLGFAETLSKEALEYFSKNPAELSHLLSNDLFLDIVGRLGSKEGFGVSLVREVTGRENRLLKFLKGYFDENYLLSFGGTAEKSKAKERLARYFRRFAAEAAGPVKRFQRIDPAKEEGTWVPREINSIAGVDIGKTPFEIVPADEAMTPHQFFAEFAKRADSSKIYIYGTPIKVDGTPWILAVRDGRAELYNSSETYGAIADFRIFRQVHSIVFKNTKDASEIPWYYVKDVVELIAYLPLEASLRINELIASGRLKEEEGTRQKIKDLAIDIGVAFDENGRLLGGPQTIEFDRTLPRWKRLKDETLLPQKTAPSGPAKPAGMDEALQGIREATNRRRVIAALGALDDLTKHHGGFHWMESADFDVLIDLFLKDDSDVSSEVLNILDSVSMLSNTPTALPAGILEARHYRSLLAAVHSSDPDVRRRGFDGLTFLAGEPAAQSSIGLEEGGEVIKALADNDQDVRGAAVWITSELLAHCPQAFDDSSLRTLMDLLKGNDPRAAEAAVAVLEKAAVLPRVRDALTADDIDALMDLLVSKSRSLHQNVFAVLETLVKEGASCLLGRHLLRGFRMSLNAEQAFDGLGICLQLVKSNRILAELTPENFDEIAAQLRSDDPLVVTRTIYVIASFAQFPSTRHFLTRQAVADLLRIRFAYRPGMGQDSPPATAQNFLENLWILNYSYPREQLRDFANAALEALQEGLRERGFSSHFLSRDFLVGSNLVIASGYVIAFVSRLSGDNARVGAAVERLMRSLEIRATAEALEEAHEAREALIRLAPVMGSIHPFLLAIFMQLAGPLPISRSVPAGEPTRRAQIAVKKAAWELNAELGKLELPLRFTVDAGGRVSVLETGHAPGAWAMFWYPVLLVLQVIFYGVLRIFRMEPVRAWRVARIAAERMTFILAGAVEGALVGYLIHEGNWALLGGWFVFNSFAHYIGRFKWDSTAREWRFESSIKWKKFGFKIPGKNFWHANVISWYSLAALVPAFFGVPLWATLFIAIFPHVGLNWLVEAESRRPGRQMLDRLRAARDESGRSLTFQSTIGTFILILDVMSMDEPDPDGAMADFLEKMRGDVILDVGAGKNLEFVRFLINDLGFSRSRVLAVDPNIDLSKLSDEEREYFRKQPIEQGLPSHQRKVGRAFSFFVFNPEIVQAGSPLNPLGIDVPKAALALRNIIRKDGSLLIIAAGSARMAPQDRQALVDTFGEQPNESLANPAARRILENSGIYIFRNWSDAKVQALKLQAPARGFWRTLLAGSLYLPAVIGRFLSRLFGGSRILTLFGLSGSALAFSASPVQSAQLTTVFASVVFSPWFILTIVIAAAFVYLGQWMGLFDERTSIEGKLNIAAVARLEPQAPNDRVWGLDFQSGDDMQKVRFLTNERGTFAQVDEGEFVMVRENGTEPIVIAPTVPYIDCTLVSLEAIDGQGRRWIGQAHILPGANDRDGKSGAAMDHLIQGVLGKLKARGFTRATIVLGVNQGRMSGLPRTVEAVVEKLEEAAQAVPSIKLNVLEAFIRNSRTETRDQADTLTTNTGTVNRHFSVPNLAYALMEAIEIKDRTEMRRFLLGKRKSASAEFRPWPAMKALEIKRVVAGLIALANRSGQWDRRGTAGFVNNLLDEEGDIRLDFQLLMNNPDLDSTHFFAELQSAIETKLQRGQLSIENFALLIENLEEQGVPRKTLDEIIEAALKDGKKFTIVARGARVTGSPEDKKIAAVLRMIQRQSSTAQMELIVEKENAASWKGLTPHLIGTDGDLIHGDGTLFLSELQAYTSLEKTLLIVPERTRVQLGSKIFSKQELISLAVATIGEILEGQDVEVKRFFSGMSLFNSQKVIEMVGRSA